MDFTLLEALPGNCVVLLPNDPTFPVVAVSNDLLHTTGISKDQISGTPFFDLFPPNPTYPHATGVQNLRASFAFVLHHKERHQLLRQRYDIRGADGTFNEKYWEVCNAPLLDDEKNVRYIIHTSTDVTERVMATRREGQFREMERGFGIFMQAPVAVCIVSGPDYFVELANRQMQHLLGRTSSMIGKPLEESLTEAKTQGLMAILEQVKRTGKSFHAPSYPAELMINGVREQRYFDLVFQPFFQDENDPVPSRIFCVAYNVTRQIRAQKELEELQLITERQKRLYETINSSTPDLIYVFDLNYRFAYANKALLDMWGRSAEEAIGKGLLANGYEPWHAEKHEKEIDTVVATKKPIRGEVSFQHALLGSRVYDYIFVPVINEKGDVEAVAGSTRDITEIRQANEAILESEERFRNLADDSPLFVFIIGPEDTAPVSYWNKNWLHYTGQSMEEAVGSAWNGIIHPDDVSIVMEHYTPAYEKEEAYFIPAVRVKRYDGVYRWHAFKGNPRYLPNGSFNGYVGVGMDIHDQKIAEEALKQSEAHTRLAVESAKLGTFEVNMAEHSMLASARALEVFGFDPSRQWPYEAFINAIHPDDVATRDEAHARSRETGELFYESRIVRPDGSVRWIRLNGNYLFNTFQSNILVGTIMDITEERKAAEVMEQKIEERTRELKQVNDQLKQFTYAASHDLQEPLRKISYFLDHLLGKLGPVLDEDNKKIADRIQHTTGRMRALIDDLLSYSNTTLGSTGFIKVDLSELVRGVLDDMEATMLEKGAHIHVQPLPVVNGDERQLRQLFQNLLSNALKYHKTGESPTVQVSCREVNGEEADTQFAPERRNGKFYRIEVKDNGIGFDPDDSDRIFRIFQRLHGKAEYEGTGIGLAIVEKVVENHHGYIWAESEAGKGAAFIVLLPVE